VTRGGQSATIGLALGARAFSTDLALAGLLCALKLIVDACVLRAGFSHVSDDDYARTVIAEQFAYAPRLDPSATSWLPLPFWIVGTSMRILGRTLGAARVVAVVLGAAGVVPPFAAMRSAGIARPAALAATFVGMCLPWNAWLGVATVPDGWTAGLIAAGAIAMREEAARPWCAAAFFVASLSRYEAWPACAVLTIVCVLEARRAPDAGKTRRAIACALGALAGPALWMAWNEHAHGSPLHFFARVSTFRRSIGAADAPLVDKILGYPRAFLTDSPEAAALAACAVVAFVAGKDFRRRWRYAAGVVLAVFAFLIVGDLGDGAPTHHPARALGGVVWIAVAMGIDAIARALGSLPAAAPRIAGAVASAAIASAWVSTLPTRWAIAPGRSDSEQRDAQIARGLELERLRAESAVITPCQFEHFALLAAWGEPERAHVNERTGAPVTKDCPEVTP
jgi:hypothetical protein